MTYRRDIIRWSVSCLTVLICYSAAATAILAWEPHYETPTAPLTIAMIDLAPLPDPTPPAPPPPPEPEVIPEPPPEVKVDVPLPPVKKPPPPKVKREEPPPQPTPVPVETAAPPPPMPAAPRVAARPDPAVNPLSLYEARLLAHVRSNLRYPRAAQTRSEQGTSYVLLQIDRSGKVISAKLDTSSSKRLLDEEAIAVIQRSDPMPAFPADITEDQLTLRLPVNFTLH